MLSASAQKVQDTLIRLGFANRIIELPDTTRTAVEAAAAIGCEVGAIVKSLIFKAQQTESPVLVIASGANRVNEKRLRELVGEKIGRADADFVRQTTGFAIGGIPPVGHPQPIQTFIDEDLFRYAEVWAAGGTPHAVFNLTPAQLLQMTGGTVTGVG